MKKYIAIASLSLVILSCNKQHNLAMKSADKEFIMNAANDFYAQKKWSKAIALYDRLPNLVAGTEDAPEVVFKSAYANYYDKNYKLAGHQFRNFSNTFINDPRREEAAYMSAICYFEDSDEYNLDQSSTESAINYLQEFINKYPNSERAKETNEKIEILTKRLEQKYFEHAKQYFKIADYRAAVVAFENLLEDFPSTSFREQSMGYLMKSKYELGINSIFDLKKDRLESAIALSKQIEKEYPNSNITKDALMMRDKLTKDLENHLVALKNFETKKAELIEKQKEKEENN